MSGGPVQGHTSGFVNNEALGQSRATSCVYHEAWGGASRPSEPLCLDHEALAKISRTLHPVRADYEALGNATSCPFSVNLEASGNANHTSHPLVPIMTPSEWPKRTRVGPALRVKGWS